MKIIRLLSLLMIAALGFTSCGEGTPEDIPFTMGEFVVNKEVIGEGQAFEAVCSFNPGTRYDEIGEFWYSIDGGELKSPRNVSEPFLTIKFNPLSANGIVRYTGDWFEKEEIKLSVNGLKRGEHVIEFIVTRVLEGEAQFREEDVTMRRAIKVNITDSDVRSSFWGESLEETKRSVDLELVDGSYTTYDQFVYYDEQLTNYLYDTYYRYTDNKLTSIVEVDKYVLRKDDLPSLYTIRFFGKVAFLKRTVYNQDAKIEIFFKPGGVLTEVQQDAFDKLVQVTNDDYVEKDLYSLGFAIYKGYIGLRYVGKSNTTLLEYVVVGDDDNDIVSQNTTYSPLP